MLHLDSTIPSGSGGSNTVLEELKCKHPICHPATAEAIQPFEVDEAPPDVHSVVFDSIDAAVIRSAAFRMTGAAGLSGIDAKGWRRLYTTASADLCHSLALLAKRISTSYVDPIGLSPFVACRLIAQNKNPGSAQLGVCETARRIVAKIILIITRGDIQDAVGSLQLCASQIAAVHATREAFTSDNTEAVLLVDASNEFNSLNCQVALPKHQETLLLNSHNPHKHLSGIYGSLCGWLLPPLPRGTQGDPLAKPMYALATIPLTGIQQVWYANDASATGVSGDLRVWWDDLRSRGPAFG